MNRVVSRGMMGYEPITFRGRRSLVAQGRYIGDVKVEIFNVDLWPPAATTCTISPSSNPT